MVEMYWCSSKTPSTAQKIKHQVYRPLVSLFWAGWEAGVVLLLAASLSMLGKWDGVSGYHLDRRWITAIGVFTMKRSPKSGNYRERRVTVANVCLRVDDSQRASIQWSLFMCFIQIQSSCAAWMLTGRMKRPVNPKKPTSTASVSINHDNKECCARDVPLCIAFGVAVVNVAIVVKAGGLWIGEKIFDDAAFDAVFARLPKLAREQIAVVV